MSKNVEERGETKKAQNRLSTACVLRHANSRHDENRRREYYTHMTHAKTRVVSHRGGRTMCELRRYIYKRGDRVAGSRTELALLVLTRTIRYTICTMINDKKDEYVIIFIYYYSLVHSLVTTRPTVLAAAAVPSACKTDWCCLLSVLALLCLLASLLLLPDRRPSLQLPARAAGWPQQ